LIDVNTLLSSATRGDGERGLADARDTDDARRQRPIALIDRQPAGEQLFQNFALTDPFARRVIRLAEMQVHAADFHVIHHEVLFLDAMSVC
jgi:hypothetical protein